MKIEDVQVGDILICDNDRGGVALTRGSLYTVTAVRTGANGEYIQVKGDHGIAQNFFPSRFALHSRVLSPAGWQPGVYTTSGLPVGGTAPIPASFPVATQMPAAPPKNKRLTDQGQKIKLEWEHLYKAEGCTCTAVHNPPCRHCSHPGHPYKLNNTPNLWEEIPDPTAAEKRANAIMEAMREIAGKSS